MKYRLLALAPFALVLAACNAGSTDSASTKPSAAPAIDQASICEVQDYRVASNCKPGQKIAFLPNRFGNEQLPVLFVAGNCDMRYSIAMTNGGVVCIFNPIQTSPKPTASSAP